ncbi:hypothetical protein AJ85_16055 [Alkalihalobacillus alcalophilus ATCC 27647 = CGMCC 1.3604]|uniref:Uncharacterized protein n=1 Tax=Alkalihalobacillus alcalophilus ATCC 27647 = CGMCC 1.3604 TaxID=1218173 RepID=A0A094WJM0_ALKAL|nr:hypothetical protein [Alkalihalobacillus alcalophilus]KGA97979.1 hypothetical protein BALCAV_0206775 [Alkalihalobacillus alcalophilus ATCC 27647 = CGMCC 1.3604]MED1563981.1 hypothetical protein [Alkalihalobacillus alcalophilus]THG89624.1 hypothetical protein AJ85_16055 [Alkalihalobacillus alcalophilus ATCC 27647 = CGMCC 1.3604]
MMLILLAFMILIPVSGFIVYKHAKFLGMTLMAIPLFLLFIFAGWWFYSINHHFVSSTSLSEEAIAGFRLGEPLMEEDFERLGSYVKREQPAGIAYSFDSLYVSVDAENLISSISSSRTQLETTSGLMIGDTIEKAKSLYGDRYYTYREMGLGRAIVYVDRENNYQLTLWTINEKTISMIWFSVY